MKGKEDLQSNVVANLRSHPSLPFDSSSVRGSTPSKLKPTTQPRRNESKSSRTRQDQQISRSLSVLSDLVLVLVLSLALDRQNNELQLRPRHATAGPTNYTSFMSISHILPAAGPITSRNGRSEAVFKAGSSDPLVMMSVTCVGV